MESTIFDIYQHFYKKLKQAYESGAIRIKPVKFNVTGIDTKYGLSLTPEPADENNYQYLWELRQKFSHLLKIKRPAFYEDKFHISIAYLYKKLTPEQEMDYQAFVNDKFNNLRNKSFTINHVKFVIFNDMLSYSPLLQMKQYNK